MMSVAYDFTPETAAAEFLRKPHQLLIDGKRVPSSSGRTFKSLNPATEEVIATIAEGNEADVNRAVAAARRAFEGPWRAMSGLVLMANGRSRGCCSPSSAMSRRTTSSSSRTFRAR